MGYGLQGMGAQQASMGQYPSIMGAPLGMYDTARSAGARDQAMNQELINQNMARYNYEANAPQQALANYMKMVTGDYGGTTTTVAPKTGGFGDSLMSGLGGKLGTGIGTALLSAWM
jgi:hypothetical protein